jgi:hypothetical protein
MQLPEKYIHGFYRWGGPYTEKYFPEVSEAAKAEGASEAEGKYFY